MKVICISLQKGGTGKTSIAVSLAAELAAQGGRTVLMDLDPQANSSTWIGPPAITHEVADVLFEEAVPAETIVPTAVSSLSLLPSAGLGGRLKVYAEREAANDHFCIKRLCRDLGTMGFRYAVLDLSPGWGSLERAAALASDEIIPPLMPDMFGIDGLEIFFEQLATLKRKEEIQKPIYKKIIVNGVDQRIRLHTETLAKIEGMKNTYQLYRFPVDPQFRKAQAVGLTVQGMTGTKPETLGELRRLGRDIINE